MKHIMTLLHWLIKLEEIKLNDIMYNMSNQLLYFTILFVNIVVDKVMRLVLQIELTFHI